MSTYFYSGQYTTNDGLKGLFCGTVQVSDPYDWATQYKEFIAQLLPTLNPPPNEQGIVLTALNKV